MSFIALCCILAAPELVKIPGQAEAGSVEIHGVAAGEYDPVIWKQNTLHFQPDLREPLLAPRSTGTFRNIYAPSVVSTPEGWRIFFGAWDGVDTGNDRIYSTTTVDFLDFGERTTVIEHGVFTHVCNVNAFRNDDGRYEMMCTAYPDAGGTNKPAYFASPDGATWNGSPAPYPAAMKDIVAIDGYAGYPTADINGMSVLLREGDRLWLYFNNFNERGKLFRATGKDGKTYTFDGPVLDTPHFVNDVKRFENVDGQRYLVALHQNTGQLWFTTSRDGKAFVAEQVLADHRGEFDKYIVAVGWVKQQNRLLGFLYGAGEAPTLDQNRIFARWLQKRVIVTGADGATAPIAGALGPDRQVIRLGGDVADRKCTVTVLSEDGETELMTFKEMVLTPGSCYALTL